MKLERHRDIDLKRLLAGIDLAVGGAHRTAPPGGPGRGGPHSGAESFTHAFAAPGIYKVRLRVKDDTGHDESRNVYNWMLKDGTGSIPVTTGPSTTPAASASSA